MPKRKTHRKWDRIIISIDPKAKEELDYLMKNRKNYSRAAIIRDAIHQAWYDLWVDNLYGNSCCGPKPIKPTDSLDD